MGQRAINEQTGEIIELDDNTGEWVSVQGPKAPQNLKPGSKLEQAFEAAMVGAGDQFATAGRNVRDLWARARGDDKALAGIADERAEAAAIRQMLRQEAPIASSVGAMLPGLATIPLSGPAGGAGVLNAAKVIGSAALMGGAQSALFSEEGDFGSDFASGAAMSGGMTIASQIVGRVAAGRRAIKEAAEAGATRPNFLTEGEREAIEAGKRAGMRTTPGMETGDDTFRKLEASLAGSPLTSRYFDEIKMSNDTQLNKLAAKALGQNADNVSGGVRVAAERAIADQFEEVGRELKHVDIGPMIKEVEAMAAEEGVKGLPRTQIDSIVRRLKLGERQRMAAAPGQPGTNLIPGEDMMEMRSVMSRSMRDAFNQGKGELGQLYGEVLERFDDAIERAAVNAYPDDPKAAAALLGKYSDARDKWTIFKAIDRNGVTEDGNILPGRMAQNLKASDRSRYWGRADKAGNSLAERGTGTVGENAIGDFYDALRFANSQIAKPIVPNTGGTVGAFHNWLNSGSTVSSVTKGIAGRLGAAPLVRAYANQSPAAYQAIVATQAALRGVPLGGRAFDVGQGIGRGLSGPGGLLFQ